MQQESKPNLFIAGAPRCGTTSLYEYLKVHPQIFGPDLKEPRFLAVDSMLLKNNSIDSKMTVTDEKKYYKLYKKGECLKYRMDGSPLYMYHHRTAEKIKNISLDSKVIIAIRNPFDRILSIYNMFWNQGKVDVGFKEFFENNKNEMYPKSTNPRGYYYEGLKNILEVMGKDRVYILKFDDIVDDTESVLKKIYEFLQVEIIVPKIVKEVFNSNKKIMMSRIKRKMQRSWMTRLIYPLLTKKSIVLIKKIIRNTSRYETVIVDDELKHKILDYFMGDIIKTEQLTGLDLSNWKKL